MWEHLYGTIFVGPPVTDHQMWQVSAKQNLTDGGTMMAVIGWAIIKLETSLFQPLLV